MRRSAVCAGLLLLSPLCASAALRGWWRFDGNLDDSSGAGLNGTALVSVDYDASAPAPLTGQSVWLNQGGTENRGVRIAANAGLDSLQFTLGYYVNMRGVAPASTSGLERLTGRNGYNFDTAIGNAAALGGTSSPTGITLSYYTGAAWYRTHVTIPPAGKTNTDWFHVVWRNSATEMKLYIDGVEVYSGTRKSNAFGANSYMNFGIPYTAVNEGFTGLMADAFIFDEALPPADIALIAASGMAGYFDTDGDGLPTAWEILHGFDPNDDGTIDPVNGAGGNPDNDGLTNEEEYDRGTNPRNPDTDGDGLNDGAEVTAGTNPALADTDGDGLNDGAEITAGTNPLLADTDGDFITDGEEVANNSDPLDPDETPPPATFLVLHLAFEGNAQDGSPLGNHGTLLNSPAFVDGDSPGGGQALHFANATPVNNQGVSVPGSNSLASNLFTLCYWVKPASNQEGSGLERLTSRSGDLFETAIGNRAVLPPGAPDLTLSYFQGGWQDSGKQLVLNDWAHVAWRNKGAGPTDMTLFINGVAVFSGPGVPVGRPGNGLMNIGTRHNATEAFEGSMDDVRLYRAPLKDSAIAAISSPVGLAPFEIFEFVRAPDGSSATLKIRSRPGRTYAVDFSTSLGTDPGSWSELTDSIPATGTETIYVDNVASNLPRVFYRARDVTP